MAYFDMQQLNDAVDGVTQPMLPRALARRSPSGVLTTAVQPGSALPNSIEALRQRAADFYKQGADLYDKEVDTSALQEFARKQGESSDSAMLNALAAQFAGESFAPVQAQFLKRAAAAREPMKLGSGMLTPDGKYIKDPFAQQDQKAQFLLQQAKAYEQMAQSAETKREQQTYREQQDRVMNELRTFMAQTGRMNALTAQATAALAAGAGGLGVGQATQIGSGPNNEPIFRQQNGNLFTYNESGQPVPYAGAVQPKASSSQPTEDERKAAGWLFQADNARRNMESAIRTSPSASMPTYGERAMGLVPGVGEDLANMMRPEDRQRFVQAASSFAEATLRAATGAGVNRDEAIQKVRELTPQLGDKPAVIKQKLESQQVYLDSLRTRANRAVPAGMPMPGAPAANTDPLGMRR